MYDISNRSTFTNGAKEWVKELRGKGLNNAQWVLVGNKYDLAKTNREVSEREAREYALDIGAMFYETSAKTGHNVNMIFSDIACSLEKMESKAVQVIKESKRSRDESIVLKERKKSEDLATYKLMQKCCHTWAVKI